jgi:hypothetical protein
MVLFARHRGEPAAMRIVPFSVVPALTSFAFSSLAQDPQQESPVVDLKAEEDEHQEGEDNIHARNLGTTQPAPVSHP